MATVTYDERSFMVDGERIWLVSGSIHYFRVPAGLWPDRLLKAKRAGLNCISTYVAWNFHEPAEGQWELDGDHDVAAFVKLAQEFGLYVILRPGPYIGADWDFGGLPGWLTSKTGVAYRTANASYTHFFDKYFGRVLPRLAELQVSRGGNIVLIQNENEYLQTTMPERLGYLEFISQLFRRSGFDVPIITCNQFSDPPVPGAVECVNVRQDVAIDLKKLTRRQRGAPLLVTELRGPASDFWGGEHRREAPRSTARKALEILGCGGQYNYYLFHGGTNFAFWGGRQEANEAAYQTTSYDCDAPVAEGGGLTRKYYLTRLVNLLADSMARSFAQCRREDPGVSIHDGTDVLNISGPAGAWAVVTNNGREDIETARISLPNGRVMEVSLAALGATAVPIGVSLGPEQTLDYTNLMPLGFFHDRILILHGPAGFSGIAGISGQELTVEVPDSDEPVLIEQEGLQIAVVNSELAMRTWPIQDAVVFGPQFVGRDVEDLVYARGARQYTIWTLEDGKLSRKRAKPGPAKTAPPRLGQWRRVSVCPEPAAGLKWGKTDRPRGVDRLGLHEGYVWYQAEIETERARKYDLFLPQLDDRATIFVNGKFVGTWGRGEDATRRPIPAPFKKGTNTLTILADNLGRSNVPARLGELKGLYGQIYDAKPLRVTKPKLKPAEPLNRRIVPRALFHTLAELEAGPIWQADFTVSLPRVTPINLSFAGLRSHVAILCNDKPAGLFYADGLNYGDVLLGPTLKKGRNTIRLLLWGDATSRDLDAICFHALQENLTESAQWRFCPWGLPAGEKGLATGKDRPAWYSARFKYSGSDRPLFVQIFGAKKGQIFLNGHNVGRFWAVGPQEFYYLPECWLADQNELLVFEERGRSPSRSKLLFRPLGPYGD